MVTSVGEAMYNPQTLTNIWSAEFLENVQGEVLGGVYQSFPSTEPYITVFYVSMVLTHVSIRSHDRKENKVFFFKLTVLIFSKVLFSFYFFHFTFP